MQLVSSVFYISRIFVNNCILFLAPLDNTLPPHPSSLPPFSISSLCWSRLPLAWGLFGLPTLTAALVLCAGIIGQGRLGEEGSYLPGEWLLCPEISSPLYAECAGAVFEARFCFSTIGTADG